MQNYDMSQFMRYAKDMANTGYHTAPPVDNENYEYMLRFWRENKNKYLYRLLGEELILTKTVQFNRPVEEIDSEMRRMLINHSVFMQAIFSRLEDCLHPKYGYGIFYRAENEDARFIQSVKRMFDSDQLIDGRITQSAKATILGHEVQLTEGQKVMRALGRIAGFLDLSQEYEDFRIAHSQILNQRNVSGELNLSIHPLDFATASDNVNGWSSCMSWQEEGCYRLGTVEMMNSPMVLCAYLSGKNEMDDVGDGTWNSKKWRAWMIVTDELILVNRQYPYTNQDLAITAVNWVRELALQNLGWHFRIPEIDLDYNHFGYRFETNYMYNDVCEDHPGALAIGAPFHKGSHTINFSGPAECMWCGKKIPYDERGEAGTLCCPECSNLNTCHICGVSLSEDNCYWGPDDECYCCDCYSNNFYECEHCGDICYPDDTYHIHFPGNAEVLRNIIEAADHKSSVYKFYTERGFFTSHISDLRFAVERDINVCEYCLRNAGIELEDFELFYKDCSYYFNPNTVTYEQFYQIFRPFDKTWNDTDGSITRAWEQIYEAYREKFNTELFPTVN